MDDSLLVSLRSYRPRPDRDPLEDFVTEAFAWLLRNHPDVGQNFLIWVDSEIGLSTSEPEDPTWDTQVSVDAGIVDMRAAGKNRIYIFEHKIWGKATADQLHRYRRSLEGEGREVVTTLITGARYNYEGPSGEDISAPDLRRTWADIYKFLEGEVEKGRGGARARDFLALLDHEGLGPRERLTEPALRALPDYTETLEKLYALLSEIRSQKENWAFAYDLLPDSQGKNQPTPKWSKRTRSKPATLHGRIALSPYSGSGPDLRAGFIVDAENIKTELTGEGPDLAVYILLPRRDLGSRYSEVVNSQAYEDLCQSLREADTSGWAAHIRKGGEPGVNDHHPIVLQKPLTSVLRGATTAEEERDSVMEAFREGVELFLQGDAVARLRDVIARHQG